MAVFGNVPWQGYQFQMLQKNASQYIPRQAMKKEVSADIRTIFNAPGREQAEILLAKNVKKYERSAPRLADWMKVNIPSEIIHQKTQILEGELTFIQGL